MITDVTLNEADDLCTIHFKYSSWYRLTIT